MSMSIIYMCVCVCVFSMVCMCVYLIYSNIYMYEWVLLQIHKGQRYKEFRRFSSLRFCLRQGILFPHCQSPRTLVSQVSGFSYHFTFILLGIQMHTTIPIFCMDLRDASSSLLSALQENYPSRHFSSQPILVLKIDNE